MVHRRHRHAHQVDPASSFVTSIVAGAEVFAAAVVHPDLVPLLVHGVHCQRLLLLLLIATTTTCGDVGAHYLVECSVSLLSFKGFSQILSTLLNVLGLFGAMCSVMRLLLQHCRL